MGWRKVWCVNIIFVFFSTTLASTSARTDHGQAAVDQTSVSSRHRHQHAHLQRHGREDEEGQMSGEGKGKMVAAVGKLTEVQIPALLGRGEAEMPCDLTLLVLQGLPVWLLYDKKKQVLHGVPTSSHAAQSSTVTLLCPSLDKSWRPVTRVTVSVVFLSSESCLRLPSGSFPGGDSLLVRQFPGNEHPSSTSEFMRREESNKGTMINFSDKSSLMPSFQMLSLSDEAAGSLGSDSGQSLWKLNTLQGGTKCTNDYVASLVLCVTPEKTNDAQRVQIMQRSAAFLSVHHTLLTWRTCSQGQLHFMDQGYTLESGGTTDHRQCFDSAISELFWPLSCSASRHVKEFTKILQHNVKVGRIQQEVGVEVVGWYVAGKTMSQLSHRRRRRQIQTRTPVPTPTLYSSSAAASLLPPKPHVTRLTDTSSLSLSTMIPAMHSTFSTSQMTPAGSSSAPSTSFANRLFPYTLGVEPTPSTVQQQYATNDLLSDGVKILPTAGVISSVVDAVSVTRNVENTLFPSALQSSVVETSPDTSRFLYFSETPTPALSSAAVKESVLSTPGDSVFLSSSSSSNDLPSSAQYLSSARLVSVSQLEDINAVSFEPSVLEMDTVKTVSKLDVTTTSPFLQSGSAETFTSLTQLDFSRLSSAFHHSTSMKELGTTELSSVKSDSVLLGTSFMDASTSHFARIALDSVSTPLPSSSSAVGISRGWPLLPADIDYQLTPDATVTASIPRMGWSQVSAVEVSGVGVDTAAFTQGVQDESVGAGVRLFNLVSSPASHSPYSTGEEELTALSSGISATRTEMADSSAFSHGFILSSQLSSQLIPHSMDRYQVFSTYNHTAPSMAVSAFLPLTTHALKLLSSTISASVDPRPSATVAKLSPSESTTGIFSEMPASREVYQSRTASEDGWPYSVSAAFEAFSDQTSLHTVITSSAALGSRFDDQILAQSQTFSAIILYLGSAVGGDGNEIISSVHQVPMDTRRHFLSPVSFISSVVGKTSICPSYSAPVQSSVKHELRSDVPVIDSTPWLSYSPKESVLHVADEIGASLRNKSDFRHGEISAFVEVEKTADHSSFHVDGMVFSESGTMLPTSETRQYAASIPQRFASVSFSPKLMPSSAALVQPSLVIPTRVLNLSDNIADREMSVSSFKAATVSTLWRSSETATVTSHSVAVNRSDVNLDKLHSLTETAPPGTTSIFETSSEISHSLVDSLVGLQVEPSKSQPDTILSDPVFTIVSISRATFANVSVRPTRVPDAEASVSDSVASLLESSFTPFVTHSEMMSSSDSIRSEISLTSTLPAVRKASTSSALSTSASATVSTSLTSVTSSVSISATATSTTSVSPSSPPTTSTTLSARTVSSSTKTTSTSPGVSRLWTTTGRQRTDWQTYTRVSSTLSTGNTHPLVVNPTHYLSAMLGRYFDWQVPDDMFFDAEDGTTRSLTLTLTLPRNDHPVPSNFWVQFDPVRQVVYGLPLLADLDTGYHSVVIVATDSRGLGARNPVNLYVNSSAFALFTHRFDMRFAVDFSHVMRRRENLMVLVKKISSYYGDPSADSVTVVDVSTGSFILSWTNSSLRGYTCPNQTLQTNLNRMVRSDGTVRNAFSRHIGPKLKLHSVVLKLQGACLLSASTTPLPPTHTGAAGTGWDGLKEVILPVLIALLSVLLVVIVLLFVHRCWRRRESMEVGDKELSSADRGPVILPGDLPDANGYHARPKPPIILPVDQEPQHRHPRNCPHHYELDRKMGSLNRHRPSSYGVDGGWSQARPVTVIFNNFDSPFRQSGPRVVWHERGQETGPTVRVADPYVSTSAV